MRYLCSLVLSAVIAIPLAAAQQTETKITTKTTVEVKEGRNVIVVGCLQVTPGGGGYVVTNVVVPGSGTRSYVLITDDDLSKSVGHHVEITGKAADRDKGKIETRTKTTVDNQGAPDRKTESKTEIKGDLANLPFLGVKSVKSLRSSCS